MIYSMTAFARHSCDFAQGRLVWELRSVNHRYAEVYLRLPEDFRALETELRSRLNARVKRGKIDAGLRIETTAGVERDLNLNDQLADAVIRAAEKVASMITDKRPLDPFDVLKWPGVIDSAAQDLDSVNAEVLVAFDATLDQLLETRAREGAKLREFVFERCAAMATLLGELRTRVPEIIDSIKTRHEQRIHEIAGSLDESRIEQECALLLQKLDVSEEFDRVEAHLGEVSRVLNQESPVGRRLDFLLQELNREANTIGSKSAHIDTANASVELKVLIEQIREQIQNIE